MRLRCYLREIRGERSLADICRVAEELTGMRVNHGELSRIENGLALPRDHMLAALVAAYGASIEDWYPPLVFLAVEFDDDKLSELRARLRTTLLPKGAE